MLKTRWDEAAIFRPPPRGPLAQAIADQIRRRIVTGDLAAGRRLPPIHRLAKLHGVSVPTAHAAVHVLVALGFVRTSPGVGTFVRRTGKRIASLNHGWMHATPVELAHMRAAIDERMPVLLARQVAAVTTWSRMPQTLSDISMLANERALRRDAWPETFLRRDVAFHECIARSVRGMEVVGAVHAAISMRLLPHLVPAADVVAADWELGELHRELAVAVLDGSPVSAGRIARRIARRELASIEDRLG